MAWPTCRRRRPAHLAITVMSMKPSAANRCADALHAMTGDCSSSRFYRARTTANGSAIRHDRQRRHARLSEPAPPRRVDGDLSPRGPRPTSGGRRAWRQSDPRRKFQTSRLGNSSTAKSRRQIFARRKEWRRLSTPIGSAGRRRLSPIRLCLTGAAPAGLRSSAPLCAAPPSQRRSQLSYTSLQGSLSAATRAATPVAP